MVRPAWVVLDLGETLVDETRQWALWAQFFGVPSLTFAACLGAMIEARRPHTDVIELFSHGLDVTTAETRKDAQGLGLSLTERDLYPDALPTLHRLRADGYRTAVMANQPSSVEPFLASLPVDAWATSATWGIAKPDPAFFVRVARELSAEAHDVAYVGDRIDSDVLPAKKAGMTAIHLRRGPWGLIQAQWPEAREADLNLDALSDLPDALQMLTPAGTH